MYYKYKNTKIYYEKYNNKNKVLLILPGWGDTRKTFDNIIYNCNTHTTYIIDYPSFGKSPTLNKVYTIYDYAELIYNFIKENNLKDIDIIAHSFGGRIASILISKYNIKVNKLILLDVAGIKRINIKTIIKKIIYKILKHFQIFLPKKLKQSYLNKLINIFASTDYKEIDSTMRKTFSNIVKEDLKKYYKNIDIDTLIIWGENDQDTPLKDAYTLKRIIKKSALIIYKKASHFSYLDYPLLTNKIIDSYIKKQ